MKAELEQLLTDQNFETGFDLMTPSTENGRALSSTIDYGGEAVDTISRPWKMAQWWTPYDFKDADFTKNGEGKYHYENTSRRLDVDTGSGSITMGLDSYTEYMEKLGHSRLGTENWSHFLIEQDFGSAPRLKDLAHVYVSLEFSIDTCVDKDPSQAVPCAQISWYFTITDVKNGDSGYQSGDNEYFWFGLPLFDSRYDFVSSYRHVDSGFVGATNKLIYTLGSDTYLSEKVQLGKKYTVKLDILPYIKEAFLYGYDNGAMSDSSWQDLVLNYMNLGWELPGSFDAAVTISELSIQIERKK